MAAGEKLEVQVFACKDGSGFGKEEDKNAWELCYKGEHELAHVIFDRFQVPSAQPTRPCSPFVPFPALNREAARTPSATFAI